MIRGIHLVLTCALALVFASAARAATPTFIESADGKRVLSIEPRELNNPYRTIDLVSTGKTILYVHENGVYVDRNAEPVIVVEDSKIRPPRSWLTLANFDGDDVRHGRSSDGKPIMNYHHPDLCPNAHANRVFRVTGPELTKVELLAVLYALRPEGFKLTDAELAEQKKMIADAQAEDEKRASEDPVPGAWDILTNSGPVEKAGRGKLTFGPPKDGAYTVQLDCSKFGGPQWTGMAVSKEVSGDRHVFTAYGTAETIGLCVYEIKGGTLKGKWYPWYFDGDAKNVGTEDLQGPDKLDGDFKITAAKAPRTGAAYAGTVTIKPANIVGEADSAKSYNLTWTLGTVQIKGIGIRTKDVLYVSSGSGADVNVAAFTYNNGSITGDWFKMGSKEKGIVAATK